MPVQFKFPSFRSLRANAGFTMIELLIVIAILGVLAVAVLSAINPVEQINRGRDTGSRSDAEQLLSAIERFYTFQNFFPWINDPNGSYTLAARKVDATWTVTGITPACKVLDRMSGGDGTATCIGSEELKKGFNTRVMGTSYNTLWVYNAGTPGASTYVCFKPKSGAFLTEAQTRCNTAVSGALPTDYPTGACGGANWDNVAGNDYVICLP